MTGKTSRREFFGGKPGREGPGGAAPEGRPAGEAPGAGSGGSYLVSVSRSAMACQFELVFNAGQYPNDTEAAVKALDLVEELESQLSYFRPTSQISRLNMLAADAPVEVDRELFDLVALALDLADQTRGALDITSAPLWEAWGFARRGGRTPSHAELSDALRHVGSHLVELDPVGRTIRFKSPGVRLSLGSLGKGYALDRAAEVLAASGIADFVFHGGQSSVLARGSERSERPEAGPSIGWTVGVRHPLRLDQRIGEIRLRDRGLGTSGSTFQYFRRGGRRYGHILDPRSGMPADRVLAATVVAPSATLADALSTAFFVMGPEETAEYCAARPEIAALLVCPAKGGRGFRTHAFGFRDQLALFDPG